MLTGVLWKYATGGLAILCVTLFLLLQGEKIHSAKVEKRAEYYRSELVRITEAKDKQRTVTETNVRIVERDTGAKIVERIVKVPNPANCATPKLDPEALNLL